MTWKRAVASLGAAAAAYGLYSATLLPGQDLGDTAVFQVIAAVGAPPTARDGYPLYYFLARGAASADPVNPAGALNRLSARTAALAVGVLAWVAGGLTASPLVAIMAALLFGSSYTFWTQAIIAEVYALHLLLVMVSMAALLTWSQRPTLARLGLFFALYALAFGNHLSMVLLLPAFAASIVVEARHHPGGLRSVFRGRVVVLALASASAGALQYAGMLRLLWDIPRPLSGVREVLSAFWFDVTRADWRQTLVLGVRLDQVPDRLAMYVFELRQQFGGPAIAVAVLGAVMLVRSQPRRALMLTLAYAVTFLFAFTYNVGDTHVFYLSSHLVVALWFAYGLACVLAASAGLVASTRARRVIRGALLTLVAAYVAWRVVDTYPAVDRSSDRRAERFFDAMTEGLTSSHDVLMADLNWQQIDGLAYYAAVTRPDVIWCQTADVLPHFPAFVRDNREIGRNIVFNRGARDRVVSAFGNAFGIQPDPRASASPLMRQLEAIPGGTPYVLTWLTPYQDAPVDRRELGEVLRVLTRGAHMPHIDAGGRYVAVAGQVDSSPVLARSDSRPFRASADVNGSRLLVRFDAWLPFDSIRRSGFGHVIVGSTRSPLVGWRDVLRIDRGLSLAILHRDGRAAQVFSRGGILESEERFLIQP